MSDEPAVDWVQGEFQVSGPASTKNCFSGVTTPLPHPTGALYSILFTAAAACPPEASVAEALAAGAAAIQKYGGASRGNRTMLDSLLPAIDVLLQAPSSGVTGMVCAQAP